MSLHLDDCLLYVDVRQRKKKSVRQITPTFKDLIRARAKTMQSASASFMEGDGDKAGARTLTVDRPVTLKAVDYMDDGTKIKLCVTSSPKSGEAVFDFT